jgi:hypothetical protein
MKKPFEQDQKARQLHKAQEVLRIVFVAHDHPAIALQPGEQPLNGLIANDKFCMSRAARLRLTPSRSPRIAPLPVCTALGYPEDPILASGGAHETTVDGAPPGTGPA